MIELLRLIPTHGNEQLRAAVEATLACGSSDAATVLHLLKPETRSEHRAEPLAGTGAGYERPLPKIDMYGQLLSAREVQPSEVRA
jgi:hypothetical protein